MNTIVRFGMAGCWIALGAYMYEYLLALGKALGGTQYFGHMNQAGPAIALALLAIGCCALACLLIIRPRVTGKLATTVGWAGLSFAIAQLLPLPLLGLLATYVRPFGFAGQFALFLVPLAALITIAEPYSLGMPESDARGTDSHAS